MRVTPADEQNKTKSSGNTALNHVEKPLTLTGRLMRRTSSKTISSSSPDKPLPLTVVHSSFVKICGGILSKWPRERRAGSFSRVW